MASLRYYMYLRKSNESDEKQELSIPAQEGALNKIVAQRGLTLVGEPLRESQSAKTVGRPLFNEMLAGIKAGKADAILCWHLDRLSRNPYDEMQIKCGLTDGIIKEVVTTDRTYRDTPDDGLMSSIVFAMATKYSQDLSINIRRGNRAALERGFLPSRPKLGYRRDQATKGIVPDEERFGRVREIWRLRLNGTPIDEILRIARDEWALTTPQGSKRGGNLISRSALWRLLGDPFYAGVIARREGTFQGSHPPMISWAEWEKAQGLIKKEAPHTGPRHRLHPFTYRGIFNCGSCGALVTAEYTTNRYGSRYTHWHCSRKRRTYRFCPERSIEERALESQLDEALGSLRFPDHFTNLVLEEVDWWSSNLHQAASEAAAKRATELIRIDRELKGLRSMCASGLIEAEEFDTDRQELFAQKKRLEETGETESLTKRLELFRERISLANLAQFYFRAGGSNERREIVQALFSNPLIRGKTVLVEANEPIAALMKIRDCPQMCTVRDTIRTLIQESTSFDSI